ncbi:amino acid permease 2-like, partial [Trifolium medium]|nr:amino acid permease 2-like [Trifolium medium]
MALPSFTDIIGILGAVGFWSLAVYFPITMYLSEKKIRKWTRSW